MCVNFRPPKPQELIDHFHVDIESGATWPAETWKDYPAPIIRQDANGVRQVVIGTYGMVPKKHIPEGVKAFDTMNARAERTTAPATADQSRLAGIQDIIIVADIGHRNETFNKLGDELH